jgi:hypothetical protein
MAYLLDANVFITAKNLHYGLDFCPAFWEWLLQKNREDKVFSIEQVGDEVLAVEDELSDWAKPLGSGFFLKSKPDILPALGEVSRWAAGQGYEPTAVATFLQAADYYLIAWAHAGGHTVVSHETVSDSKKKIKIPNVCVGMSIKFMSPYSMLRLERARFVLGEH